MPPAYSPPKNIKVDYDPRLCEIGCYPNPRQNIPANNMPTIIRAESFGEAYYNSST